MINAFERFYPKQEWRSRTIQIENELYNKLKYISENEIEASLNKLIDACVENFNIENNKIVYYKKADTEIVVKSSIRLRQIMWDKLDNMKSQYDISVQKLINLAIKYTLEMYDNEKKK